MARIGLCLLLTAACAHRQQAKANAAGEAKDEAVQLTPLESARKDLAGAQDLLAKARASQTDAQARLEVAKSEREVGDAQAKRAATQRELVKKQTADKDALNQADQDFSSAQATVKEEEAKLAFLTQNLSATAAERGFAEARVATQEALVEEARPGAAQHEAKLAEARKREEEAQKQAADSRAKAEALLGRWQKNQ